MAIPLVSPSDPAAPAGLTERGPASQAKRDAIVNAAAAIFLEQGYWAASIDEIARRANVSKATVYSHFDNKHALFGAIVGQRCQRTLSSILADMSDRPVGEALTAVGRQFLDVLMMPGSLPLYRLVLAEAPRFPELGRIFYEAGPDRVASALAQYLEQLHKRGVLDVPDPRLAAEQFFGAVLGQIHVRMLLGVASEPPPADERERVVANVVRLFTLGVSRRSA
ncbi:MAG: TetR/AcrR family transcriptional regulator [Proteobacteria bacterium]|nr:TetR/AcrR family transcriptional regulator [Pseudomonadota bacterium]